MAQEQEEDVNNNIRRLVSPPNPKDSFPARLHRMLTDIDLLSDKDAGWGKLRECVSWMDHGKSFKIHKKTDFENVVMPVWFNRLKCNSFLRQLSLYGFARSHRMGDEKGAWSHKNFQRDKPELASRIERLDRVKRKGKSKTAEKDAPKTKSTPGLDFLANSAGKPVAGTGATAGWQDVPGNEDILGQLLISDLPPASLQRNTQGHGRKKDCKYSSSVTKAPSNNTATASPTASTTNIQLPDFDADMTNWLALETHSLSMIMDAEPSKQMATQPTSRCAPATNTTTSQLASASETYTNILHKPADVTDTTCTTITSAASARSPPNLDPFWMGLEPTPIAEQPRQSWQPTQSLQLQQHQQEPLHAFLDVEPLRVFRTNMDLPNSHSFHS